jgi:CspA family cold shock protein
MTGKIRWFDIRKGYGFIECETDQKDVFVHITQVDTNLPQNFLQEGLEVEFQISQGTKPGQVQAQKVRRL